MRDKKGAVIHYAKSPYWRWQTNDIWDRFGYICTWPPLPKLSKTARQNVIICLSKIWYEQNYNFWKNYIFKIQISLEHIFCAPLSSHSYTYSLVKSGNHSIQKKKQMLYSPLWVSHCRSTESCEYFCAFCDPGPGELISPLDWKWRQSIYQTSLISK